MFLLDDNVMEILRALADSGSSNFELVRMEKDASNWFLIVVLIAVSYVNGRDMSFVNHGIAVTRCCRRCMVASDDTSDP